jgi:hypothetical protein
MIKKIRKMSQNNWNNEAFDQNNWWSQPNNNQIAWSQTVWSLENQSQDRARPYSQSSICSNSSTVSPNTQTSVTLTQASCGR